MTGTAATMGIEENLALARRRGTKRGLRKGITPVSYTHLASSKDTDPSEAESLLH